jgi:hypothetical protein
MDQVSTGSAKEYYKNPDSRGNVTLFDVKGYTNVQPGTIMNFALDEKDQTRVHWFNTTAMNGNPGDMRTFEVFIPVYWDDLKAGVMHTISGYTDIGGSIFRDFPVRESPDHSFIPEQSVKWIDDRNPWVPTPTPITVTQVVTQMVTVTIPVTPSNEQVLAQQLEAVNITETQKETDYWNGVKVAAVIVVILVILIGGILYLRSVNRRARDV